MRKEDLFCHSPFIFPECAARKQAKPSLCWPLTAQSEAEQRQQQFMLYIQAVSHKPTKTGSWGRRIVIYLEEIIPPWVTQRFIQLFHSTLPRLCLKSQAGLQQIPWKLLWYVIAVKSQDHSANKWDVSKAWVCIKETDSSTVALNVWIFVCKVSEYGFILWSSLFISIISISRHEKNKSKMSPKMTDWLPVTMDLLKSCWVSY